MKKIIFAALCLLLAGSTNAQNKAAPYYGFRIGLTAHPTFGKISAVEGNSRGMNLGLVY